MHQETKPAKKKSLVPNEGCCSSCATKCDSENTERSAARQLLAGIVLFVAALCAEHIFGTPRALTIALYVAAYAFSATTIFRMFVGEIRRGEIFSENTLMIVASLGAMAIGEYPEAVAVMIFFRVGEFLQDRAVNKSRKSIEAILDIRPAFANLVAGDALQSVEPEAVKIGDMIVVKPGERIPLDGVVEDGTSDVDTSAVSGESLPVEVSRGEEILSGGINLSSPLRIRVTKKYADSTVANILKLVEESADKKAETEKFIKKFAVYYTPAVVGFAALMFAVPVVIFGWSTANDWAYRALVFLVVSCPCALVLSVPLCFFCGVGVASRNGILVKGATFLEVLARAKTFVFDKTGTLTKGKFKVVDIVPEGMTRDALLEITAYAEAYSNHPIARSIKNAYAKKIDMTRVGPMKDLPGLGLESTVDGKRVVISSAHRKRAENADAPKGTIAQITVDGTYAGYIRVEDEIKADARVSVQRLRDIGIADIVMLTGDNRHTADAVAAQIGITHIFAELLPSDKVTHVERLLAAPQSRPLIFVGDGINDAPVLALADAGVAMGGVGADAAIESADLVIMNDELTKLADGVLIARKTIAIVKQTIVFVLAVKFAIMALSAFGYASMWLAVFADVGVSLLAVLNSLRIMLWKRNAA